MWILENSKELLEHLKSPNFNHVTSIKSFDFSTLNTTIPHDKLKSPPWGPGGLSRECAPPYPQRDRKRRLNGAVCRNHRIKRLVPCRCYDWHVKEPYEMSMAWEPDRRSNSFFSPPAHLCAVTYMTEISLIVTLNNQFTHTHSHKLKSRLTSIIRNSFIFKNSNCRYKYLVLGHEEEYFAKEHSDSKNNYSEDDIINGVPDRQRFCGKGFPADSRYSNGNNLCPSSSRHISLLIWSRIYIVFALNREETVGVSVQFHTQVHCTSMMFCP